jgi:hypothetical protein
MPAISARVQGRLGNLETVLGAVLPNLSVSVRESGTTLCSALWRFQKIQRAGRFGRGYVAVGSGAVSPKQSFQKSS